MNHTETIHGNNHSWFRGMAANLELLQAWTLRTIQARYKQSLLGGVWAILQPAARAVVLTVIFTRFIPVDTGNVPYIVFSYAALVPWLLFASALTDMVDSLVTNINLVTKIYFPREILAFAALLARLVDFVIAFGLLLLIMLWYEIPIFTSTILYLPLILGVQLLFTMGLGLSGAALNVYYRDVRHLAAFGIQLWFYATPIIYPTTKIPEHLLSLYYLNPLAGLIEAYRNVLLEQRPPGDGFVMATVIAVVTFIVGYWFFKRVEPQFADIV
jgi:lipopolysaccharide transport system permease protein